MKCQAKTKNGKRCSNNAVEGDDFCWIKSHKSKKPTSAERELRVMTVLEMLTKGKNRDFIIRFCSDEYKVGERAVDNYIADAKKRISKEIKIRAGEEVDMALLQFNDLYDKNYQIQDYRECRQVLESKLKYLEGRQKESPKSKKKGTDNVRPISEARKKF